jgi:uncharacterized membrane protein
VKRSKVVTGSEAILLSIFILTSQNRAVPIGDKRSHLDLQLNLLSEQENTKMREMLQQIGSAVADLGGAEALRGNGRCHAPGDHQRSDRSGRGVSGEW